MEGNWSLRLNSSNDYFNSNSSTYADWFWLENINTTNTSVPKVTPDLGGWTRVYNYSVNISDVEGDTVNCSLFVSRDGQVSWNYEGSYVVAGTPGTPTTGTCWVAVHNFVCSDKGDDNYFKWQFADSETNNTHNTSSVQGPNLTESLVTVTYIAGNNTYVNRSAGLNQISRFGINVYDTENGTYVQNANVSFWVTNDSAAYRLDLQNQTDSLGNASYYFNPDCTYAVGLQNWIAGTADSCYEDKNLSANRTTYVIGDLSVAISQPLGGTEFKIV